MSLSEIADVVDHGLTLKEWAGLQDATHRPHGSTFSASAVGHQCEAFLGFTVRRFQREPAKAQQHRLFALGHTCEDLVVLWLHQWSDLRGFTFQSHLMARPKEQYKGEQGSYIAYADGVLIVPGAKEELTLVVEIKSINKAGYDAVARHGTLHAQPKYADQATMLMALLNVEATMMVYFNRESGDIMSELLAFDANRWNYLQARCEAIGMDISVEKLSNDPTYWMCKTCQYRFPCHGFPQRSSSIAHCANCMYSVLTPSLSPDSWHCTRHNRPANKVCGDAVWWSPDPRE